METGFITQVFRKFDSKAKKFELLIFSKIRLTNYGVSCILKYVLGAQKTSKVEISASGSVGGARPCQGRGRGFESRLALFSFLRHFWCENQKCLLFCCCGRITFCRCCKRIAFSVSAKESDLAIAAEESKKDVQYMLCTSCQQGYQDSNLEMTESESVALPFGDSPISFLRISSATA